jgi:hypothetical protein
VQEVIEPIMAVGGREPLGIGEGGEVLVSIIAVLE